MTELTENAKKAKAAYMRQYRRRNPEKFKERTIKYWNKRGEREAQQQQLLPETVTEHEAVSR